MNRFGQRTCVSPSTSETEFVGSVIENVEFVDESGPNKAIEDESGPNDADEDDSGSNGAIDIESGQNMSSEVKSPTIPRDSSGASHESENNGNGLGWLEH